VVSYARQKTWVTNALDPSRTLIILGTSTESCISIQSSRTCCTCVATILSLPMTGVNIQRRVDSNPVHGFLLISVPETQLNGESRRSGMRIWPAELMDAETEWAERWERNRPAWIQNLSQRLSEGVAAKFAVDGRVSRSQTATCWSRGHQSGSPLVLAELAQLPLHATARVPSPCSLKN
jgi:hypothetical protein